jgi:thiaminase/transcriptional activator TenA
MLSKRLKAPAGSFHAKWVAGYTAPEYRALTSWLRSFVDGMEESVSEEQRARMLRAFRASTRYEYLFWDAAWRLRGWPGVERHG